MNIATRRNKKKKETFFKFKSSALVTPPLGPELLPLLPDLHLARAVRFNTPSHPGAVLRWGVYIVRNG